MFTYLMRDILPPVEILSVLLPAEESMPEAERFRRSAFVVEQEVPEGKLLYNNLTKQMILLEEDDDEKNDITAKLWHGMYLVSKDADEHKTARQVRRLAQIVRPRYEGIESYIILPTTDCNAHCFYCFELNRSRLMMSKETAEKVAQYIISHKPEDCKEIKISWFGGEPLYNIGAIEHILQSLTNAGVEFSSSMVSNGYLCTPEVIAKAKEQWHLKNIQITLDGTEERYNKVKAYRKAEGSPYRTVLSNIQSLAENDIRVSIRLNIDLLNIDDMFALVRELSALYKDKKNIIIYSHVLFEYSGAKIRIREDRDRTRLFQLQKELETLIEECGFTKEKGLYGNIKTNHCMADNDHTVTVMPDGHIGKCEHYTDDEFVGHIDNETLDATMINVFKEQWPEQPECTECALYPTCIRLKKCMEACFCYPEEREMKLSEMRQGMINHYNQYKKRHENKQ